MIWDRGSLCELYAQRQTATVARSIYIFVSVLWAVGSLVVRAADSRLEGLGSIPVPPNTLRVHTEYMFVKSVGPKVLWAEARGQGAGQYFPPLQFLVKIVEVEVEIGGVAISRPFGEFRRANSYCHLYGAQGLGQRQVFF
ncbi:uncharacterized protein TNCV_2463111 [Trichonephila clavipes]|nr:uncharacterized protein TNCV_2463111 [Trichonephila clavipes]